MPTQAFGVYAAEGTAGDEVSSTYEGRHVTLLESEIVHPTHADGFVDKGDPVVFGTVAGNHGVGVSFKSAAAATDYVTIDTEGIWNLSVVASDDAGNSLVTGGDPLFINTTTCAISKIQDAATQIPFGYALGQVAAGDTAVIAVKVHWNPRNNWLEDDLKLYFGDARDVSIEWDGTNLEMLPLTDDTGSFNIGNGTLDMDVKWFGGTAANYVQFNVGDVEVVFEDVDLHMGDNDYILFGDAVGGDATLAWGGARLTALASLASPNLGDGYGLFEIEITTTGDIAGHTAANSAWLTVNSTVAAGGNIITPRTDGIYVNTGDAGDMSNALVAYGGRFQYIGDTNAAHLAVFSVNMSGGDVCEGVFSKVGGVPTTELGYVEDATTDSTKCGDIPFFVDMNTGTQYWIRIYDASS